MRAGPCADHVTVAARACAGSHGSRAASSVKSRRRAAISVPGSDTSTGASGSMRAAAACTASPNAVFVSR